MQYIFFAPRKSYSAKTIFYFICYFRNISYLSVLVWMSRNRSTRVCTLMEYRSKISVVYCVLYNLFTFQFLFFKAYIDMVVVPWHSRSFLNACEWLPRQTILNTIKTRGNCTNLESSTAHVRYVIYLFSKVDIQW